jgi:hypothetical protein
MKVLFVNKFESPDYLNDMIYHGLLGSPGVFVYESSWPGYMLKGYPNPETLYGKGFTLYARMTHTPRVCPEWTIKEKIADKYYDYVVYGSVTRCVDFLDLVLKVYSKDRIVFLDGEDWPAIARPALVDCGVYFKRELILNTDVILPISFSIPKEHVLEHVPEKSKLFATIVPGDLSTYVFDNEKDYFKDYACSYYGHTRKKAGFDCLRHYEILANGCLPIFDGINEVPETAMTSFPKSIVKKATKAIKDSPTKLENYEEVMYELLDYTRENLTTVKEAVKFIERLVN